MLASCAETEAPMFSMGVSPRQKPGALLDSCNSKESIGRVTNDVIMRNLVAIFREASADALWYCRTRHDITGFRSASRRRDTPLSPTDFANTNLAASRLHQVMQTSI